MKSAIATRPRGDFAQWLREVEPLGTRLTMLLVGTAIHAQQPTFRSEVSLVTLDVIPRDAEGRSAP